MLMRTWVVLLASILVSGVSPSRGTAEDKDAAPRKTGVFYLPSQPIVLDKKSQETGRNGDLLLRKGAEVQCVGGAGACFIEAGASLSTVGGTHVFIVKKGGTLSRIVGGKHRIYCEKGATIGPRIAQQYPIVEFDTISFEPFQAFTLKGTVQDARGKPLEGIKVHAFGLDGERLSETTTDRAGAFEFRPSKQVRWLLAELGAEWSRNPVFHKDRDLEFCRRVRLLRGWETEIREGLWGRDATVPIIHGSRDGLTLPPPTCLLGHEVPIQAMAFSGDSSSLATVSFAGRPCLWNVKTGKEVRKLLLPHIASRDLRHAPNNPWPIALNTEGKVLAFSRSDRIRTDVAFGLWDLTTGKQMHELNGHKGNVQCAIFSPDGRTLASGGVDGSIRLWEVSSGKTRQVIAAHKNGVTGLTFTRDGRHLVSMGHLPGGDNNNISFPVTDVVRVWDAAHGRVVRSFPGEADFVVFSPDERRLAGAGAPMRQEQIPPNGFRIGPHPQILVWDSDRERQLVKLSEKADALAFTRDGLLLLTATGESIRLWEVDSGQEILTCPLPQKDVSKVVFSSDGKTLAVGQQDGAVYLWSVRAHHLYVPEEKQRSDAEWATLWDDLASDKAATAYRALWTLLREPPRAVQLLKAHLRPTPPRELPLDKWIADLDNDDFAKRQAAAKSLHEAGEPAERALRKARGGKPSLEARKRIDQLLEEIGQRRPSAEELRSLRAIQLLEENGSPEAHQLLESLAKGWDEARQTREAKAALKRLHAESRAAKDID